MNFRDLIEISTGNLRRMKLRTFLTTAGVIIAIAAFVSMLSFGAGMQERVAQQFDELGLFNTMLVYPITEPQEGDTVKVDYPKLTDSVVVELMNLPGVNLAYPYDRFSIKLEYNDSTFPISAQALPEAALNTKMYSNVLAGVATIKDSTHEILITDELLEQLGVDSADFILNDTLVLIAEAPSFDSALISVFVGDDFTLWDRIEQIDFDSLFEADYRSRIVQKELQGAINRFLKGYMNKPELVKDTVIVKGVINDIRSRRIGNRDLVMTTSTARKLKSKGINFSSGDLMSMLTTGQNLFSETGETGASEYSKVTLDLDRVEDYIPVGDTLKAMGFKTFSYAEEFKEITRVMIYFNMGLGIIGLIALVTASLGIINTMVMSTIERRKEIGILKSLGADETYIKLLFLAESALIGAMGAILGIIFGWLITRATSMIVQHYMENEGIDPIELFALPLWLILISLGIGVIVSLLAGYFPASKAARIDPVEALRNE